MTAERRTDEEIRAEIAAEREQLVGALEDLRASLRARRRLAVVIGALVSAGIASAATVEVARRPRRD